MNDRTPSACVRTIMWNCLSSTVLVTTISFGKTSCRRNVSSVSALSFQKKTQRGSDPWEHLLVQRKVFVVFGREACHDAPLERLGRKPCGEPGKLWLGHAHNYKVVD